VTAPIYPAPPYGPYAVTPPEPRPVTGFVLSLVGGIFILLGGISEVMIGYEFTVVSYPFDPFQWFAVLGFIGITLGFLAIIFSVMLYLHPQHHVLFGVLILIVSISSVVSFWGYVIGLVLGVIGGVLSIAWTPVRWSMVTYGFGPPGGPYPGYSGGAFAPSMNRICLKCGMVLARETKFCPHCGNSLGP
jgi:hypothetical protein